jgi:regulator of protease activity HflC (stomatin/prohibitin superfamily)
MSRQMSAERTRRAAVTDADGHRQANITVAQGEREAQILRAEGEKQSLPEAQPTGARLNGEVASRREVP